MRLLVLLAELFQGMERLYKLEMLDGFIIGM
jgi:hypothetical protein